MEITFIIREMDDKLNYIIEFVLLKFKLKLRYIRRPISKFERN